MLHINILMSSLRGLRKKQKPTPTPAFFLHSVCCLRLSFVQSIKRYQPVTKSAVHPAGPVTPLPLPRLASFATVYAHLSCVVVAEKFWGPRTTHNYNYSQGLQGLVCLVSPPSANSIIANRMQMSWTAKLNSKQAGGKEERRERESNWEAGFQFPNCISPTFFAV